MGLFYHDYTKGNKDDLTEAIHGLDIFTKNWCMNCKETNKKNDLVFRCLECPFKDRDECLIKQFAYDREKMHNYPMNQFGCMCDHQDDN